MAEVWTPPTFDDIATTDLVTAAYLNQLGNSLRFLKEVAYAELTSPVSITASTEATAQTVVSAGAITFEAVPHLIIIQAYGNPPAVAGGNLVFNLYDGSTESGRLGTITAPTAATVRSHFRWERRITPTAASHTYSWRAWVSTGTGTVSAGAGGAGQDPAGYIRIVRIPT